MSLACFNWSQKNNMQFARQRNSLCVFLCESTMALPQHVLQASVATANAQAGLLTEPTVPRKSSRRRSCCPRPRLLRGSGTLGWIGTGGTTTTETRVSADMYFVWTQRGSDRRPVGDDTHGKHCSNNPETMETQGQREKLHGGIDDVTFSWQTESHGSRRSLTTSLGNAEVTVVKA